MWLLIFSTILVNVDTHELLEVYDALGWDQIGLFLKGLGSNFCNKSILIILFGHFEESLVK